MERIAPPFRVDHVGSLIRPAGLIAARREVLAGKRPRSDLPALEDEAIREVVALQERTGLRSITDGEFRRQVYLDFLTAIGVELQMRRSTDMFYRDAAGKTEPATRAVVTRKIRLERPVNADAFAFLKSLTHETPKAMLPAPTQIHFFAGEDGIDPTVYPDLDDFWDDVVAAYHAELAALSAVGCTYVQIDETCLPKLADPVIQGIVETRGWNWRDLVLLYADIVNRIVVGRPDGMTITIHHCRGNSAGLWQAEGGYDAVADAMFNRIDASAYFLEYDTPRAGDFSPLRFLPKDKVAVLGLVSTKDAHIEDADGLKRRIDEAARYVDLDRLCVSPQCGFSSGFAGAPMTIDDQERKLERMVAVARDVWNA